MTTDIPRIEGRVKRVWRSPLYLVAQAVVATVILILPIVYFALIGGVGYAVFWHATENYSLFMGGASGGGTGRSTIYSWILRGLLYVTPLIAGPVLVLFMVKPIFARQVTRDRRVSLVRDHEPRLFAFVDSVCEAVGAAKPKRIDIACDVNASASLRRGLLSFFGRDLVLTIGMPMVAGLTLQQFAGVLAHEFGHFTQGMAMRLTYVIHRVNGWFARIVYERDTWDEKLRDWQKESHDWVAMIVAFCRLLVWLSRLLLRLLMHGAHAISCAMLRQMEYDADRYEARLIGAEVFEQTTDRMMRLTAAHVLVMSDLTDAWKDRRLGDDLPRLIVAKAEEKPKELKELIAKIQKDQKHRLFNTHPTDEARLQRARKENEPGIFHVEGPASVLFANFERACKGITQDYYVGALGSHFRKDQLISTEALTKRRQAILKAETAAGRYFCDCLTLLRPLQLDPYSQNGQTRPNELLQTLRSARAALDRSAPVMKKTYKRLTDAEDQAMNALTAQVLANEGIKFDGKDFGLKGCSVTDARVAAAEAERIKSATYNDIVKMEKVIRMRLECALSLLRVRQIAERVPRAEALHKRSRLLLSTVSTVNAVGGELTDLRNGLPELRALTILVMESDEDEFLIRKLVRGMEDRFEMLQDLRRILQEHRYPFEHADGKISLAQYVIPERPHLRDIGGLHEAVEECLENMERLYVRCLGELALIAEKVEAAVEMGVKKKAAKAEKVEGKAVGEESSSPSKA